MTPPMSGGRYLIKTKQSSQAVTGWIASFIHKDLGFDINQRFFAASARILLGPLTAETEPVELGSLKCDSVSVIT